MYICDRICENEPNPAKHTFAVRPFVASHVDLGRLSDFFTNMSYDVLPNAWTSFTARRRSRTELRLREAGRSAYGKLSLATLPE